MENKKGNLFLYDAAILLPATYLQPASPSVERDVAADAVVPITEKGLKA